MDTANETTSIRTSGVAAGLRRAGYLLLALATGGLIAGLHAGGHFIRKDWLLLLVWMLPCALILWKLGKGDRERETGKLKPALWLLAALGIYLFSSGVSTPFSYFIRWMPEGTTPATLFDATLTWFVLLTGLLAVGLYVFPRLGTASPSSKKRQATHGGRTSGEPTFSFSVERVALGLLLIGQGLCAYQLLSFTGGANIYNDDHTSFMFRLWELAETFPQYRNYNPYWNGGLSETHVFVSGISLVGTPFIPLIKALGVESVYTYIILALYIGIVPWLSVAALRVMQADKTASYIAGCLMLGASLKFFLWMLHYGTIAANFALPFILMVAACLYRIICLEKREWWVGALLVVSSVCLLMWPLAGMAAIALIPGLFLHARKFTPRTIGFLAICAVALVLLYARNAIMILFHSSTFEKHLVAVVTHEEAKHTFTISMDIIREGWKLITDHLRESNPLVVFLGLLGVFVYPDKTFRRWFASAIFFLFLIAGWGPSYFPDLQLRRMSIPLIMLCVIPTACWASLLLQAKMKRLALVRAMVLVLVALSVWNCSRVYANESYAPYRTMAPYMEELVSWIKENVPEGTRVLFGGRTVHKYGRAHVAALPMITGHEMMACDYYAFSPKAVEYEYPPRPFRVEEDGNFRFMGLYNVSHIITHHNNYIRHFEERPHQFERVHVNEEKNIHVFRVLHEDTPFLMGTGQIDASFNDIKVSLEEPADEVVIKYNWTEGLSIDPPAELFPYEAHAHATLIGIRPNGADAMHIHFRSRL